MFQPIASSTGLAEFDIEGTDSIRYSVNASNIQDVTAGHLHGGARRREYGPIVVQLFSYDTPQNQGSRIRNNHMQLVIPSFKGLPQPLSNN